MLFCLYSSTLLKLLPNDAGSRGDGWLDPAFQNNFADVIQPLDMLVDSPGILPYRADTVVGLSDKNAGRS